MHEETTWPDWGVGSPGSAWGQSLAYCFSLPNVGISSTYSPEGEREEAENSPYTELEVRSTEVRKRPQMGRAPEWGHWNISQTLACHPGSTQPGGTAKDAGSHPTSC